MINLGNSSRSKLIYSKNFTKSTVLKSFVRIQTSAWLYYPMCFNSCATKISLTKS